MYLVVIHWCMVIRDCLRSRVLWGVGSGDLVSRGSEGGRCWGDGLWAGFISICLYLSLWRGGIHLLEGSDVSIYRDGMKDSC